MATSTDQLRQSNVLRLLAFLALMFTACQPDYGPSSVTDITLDDDGMIVPVAVDPYTDASDPVRGVSAQGQTDEVCLDDGTCLRLLDQRTIVESDNGWETSEVVWQFDPEASWLNHEYGGAFEPIVGLYDIVVANDGVVAVAGGQLGVITRSEAGEWSPTVADLRTLPFELIFLVALLAPLVLVAVGLARTRQHYGSRQAVASYILLGPALILASIALISGFGLELFILLVLSSLVAMIGAGILAGALVRAWRSPNIAPRCLYVLGGAALTVLVVFGASYGLWSRNIIGWNFAIAVCVVTAPVVLLTVFQTLARVPADTGRSFYQAQNHPAVWQVVLAAIGSIVVNFWFAVMLGSGLGLFVLLATVPVIGWLTSRLPYNDHSIECDKSPQFSGPPTGGRGYDRGSYEGSTTNSRR